jgi:hypothetical protein
MHVGRAQRLGLLLAAGLIAACAERAYEQRLIQPEGTASQPCLERCSRLQGECEARQRLREDECAKRVAAGRMEHETCVSGAAGRCVPPETCLGADMSICQSQYEECFTACGGRVERHLRQRPWEAPTQRPAPASAGQQSG